MAGRTRVSASLLVLIAAALLAACGTQTTSFAPGSLAPPPKDSPATDAAQPVSAETASVSGEDYTLVWSDEFDYEGPPDPDKWGYDVGGHGWGNNELQYYTEGENVEVRDGLLVIEARMEQHDRMAYTSTRLVSRTKGDWLYGRVEVRARIPGGRGTWPAIWMLPTDWEYGRWPASGEIDIMEHVGYEPGVVHGTVHTDRYNHMKGTQQGDSVRVADATEEFHVYAVEWLPDRIRFFVDGEQYFRFAPSIYVLDPTYREWPFDRRFHLVMNIAVGGTWGGQRGVDDGI